MRAHPGQTDVLACYQRVADATRGMLAAARACDWTSLDDCSRDCETWMQRLESLPAPETLLDAEGRRRRMQLLRQVLRDDALLRDLLQPAWGRVGQWLGAPRSAPPA
jgi:flagellar protein FliT